MENGLKSLSKSFFLPMFLTCRVCVPAHPCSLHGPLSKVPDFPGRGGLDLPHPAGTCDGPGQLGGGLLHRHLSTR